MSKQSAVCYTLDAALEEAIDFENNLFNSFLQAIRTVQSKAASTILRDAAAERLKYKQKLELARLEDDFTVDAVDKKTQTMNLDKRIGVKRLESNADSRSALAHAIHLVNAALIFYEEMAQSCSGAPMHKVFISLDADQRELLQQLEDEYEEHFMTEN